MLHLVEFFSPGDPEAQIAEIVTAVVVQHQPVVPVIHAQIAAVGLAVVAHLKTDHRGRKILPGCAVFDPDSHIPELCYLNHVVLL